MVISLCPTPWTTVCECHCILPQSHHVSFPSIVCECHCIFALSHHVSSIDMQEVSDTWLCSLMTWVLSHDKQGVSETTLSGSLVMSHPMTNRRLVTPKFPSYQAVTLCLNPMTNRRWHHISLVPGHLILPHSSNDQQVVSNAAFFLLTCSSLIMSFPIVQWTVCEHHCICLSPFSLMPFPITNRGWVMPANIFHVQSYHVSNNRWWVTLQVVLLQSSLIMFHPMTNRMWVTFVILILAMGFYSMTNRWWLVTLHFAFCHAVLQY